jgi:RimJ/RimL family protein N-acetyltransferase
MADGETTGFIGGPQARSQAWRGFMQIAGAWAMTGFSMFSVIEKASDTWIGRVGPWVPAGWPGTEVGWALVREAQGKGYAVEAAAATIDWAFDQLGWTDVIHCIDPQNVASQKVAQRLGSVNRGRCQMPAPYEDMFIEAWGQTREEWRARPKGAYAKL